MIVVGKKRYLFVLFFVVVLMVLFGIFTTQKNVNDANDANTTGLRQNIIDSSKEKEERLPEQSNHSSTDDETLLIRALETPNLGFSEWKKRFAVYAQTKNIQQNILDMAFSPLILNDEVLAVISKQPEFTKPIWAYLDTAVSTQRILRGKKLLKRHYALLQRIEKKYGVQPEYIIAIWGLETGYGTNFGRHNVLRSLATLAYGSERKTFYRNELIAALTIIQQGDISVEKMIGSWAGAMGHTQFMPSTYENYAVSFDGDTKRDLWHSLNDVFASTANYLEKSGWQKSQRWGVEVKLPDDMDWKRADPEKWLVLAEWEKIGITRVDGRTFNRVDQKEARLFLPAGHKGPVFLVFHNFFAIKKYNNADSYALAVAHLGDRIRNGKKIETKWPRDDVALSLNENKDLQSLLSASGYDTGGIDGKIGPNTRQALRHWQKDKGLPADGYVNKRILELLR